MPKLALERWNHETDGAPTEGYFRAILRKAGYEVTRYTYPPGTVFPPHTHDVDKVDVVLSGRFRMEMVGETAVLESGDSVAVPKGALHSAEVVGHDPVVSLDAVKIG